MKTGLYTCRSLHHRFEFANQSELYTVTVQGQGLRSFLSQCVIPTKDDMAINDIVVKQQGRSHLYSYKLKWLPSSSHIAFFQLWITLMYTYIYMYFNIYHLIMVNVKFSVFTQCFSVKQEPPACTHACHVVCKV